MTRELTVTAKSGDRVFAKTRGKRIHAPRNKALSTMPKGTTDMLVTNASSPPTMYIPIAAGTMVEGAVPSNPPISPPHFSMATVTAVATNPAKRAERSIEVASIQSHPLFKTRLETVK
jgi:hypothetical protein